MRKDMGEAGNIEMVMFYREIKGWTLLVAKVRSSGKHFTSSSLF